MGHYSRTENFLRLETPETKESEVWEVVSEKSNEKNKVMTLREKQSLFLKNVAKLILWAFDNGYELTGGEFLRTKDQQILYFEGLRLEKLGAKTTLFDAPKKSKTMFSDHLKKLAIDINLFIDGEYITEGEKFKPIHEYWKSLHPNNYSGYEWGWDFNHYAMRE